MRNMRRKEWTVAKYDFCDSMEALQSKRAEQIADELEADLTTVAPIYEAIEEFYIVHGEKKYIGKLWIYENRRLNKST